MVKDTWQGAYYLGSNGVMLTNAFTPDGYYVGSDGKYVKSSWVDHDRYYVDSNGLYVAKALK